MYAVSGTRNDAISDRPLRTTFVGRSAARPDFSPHHSTIASWALRGTIERVSTRSVVSSADHVARCNVSTRLSTAEALRLGKRIMEGLVKKLSHFMIQPILSWVHCLLELA